MSKSSEERLAELQKEQSSLEAGAGDVFVRGLTQGLVGPVMDMGSSGAEADWMRRGTEEYPITGALGTMAGYAGGAVTGTGIGGMLTKAGERAFERFGKSALTKLAVGAAEGATIGLAEATGKAAIDNRMDLPGAASMIAQSAGISAALGGGLALGGHALSRTANAIFRKTYSKGLKDVAKAQQAKLEANKIYNAHIKELEAMEAAGQMGSAEYQALVGSAGESIQVSGGRVARQVRELTKDAWSPIVTPSGTRVSSVLRDSPVMKAMKEMKAADQAIRTARDRSLKDVGERARSAVEDAVGTTVAVSAAGMVGLPGLGAAIRIWKPELTHAIGRKVLGGVRGSKYMNRLLGKSLQAGRITTARTAVVDGMFQTAAPSGLNQAWRAMKIPPIHYFTDQEYRDVVDEIVNANTDEFETGLRFSLASKGVPQEIADEHILSQIRGIEYMQRNIPPSPDSQWITEDNHTPVVNDEIKLRAARRLRAFMAPMSVIDDFLESELTRDAAEAWWAIYPTAAEQVAEIVQNKVDIAAAHGKKFTPLEQKQISYLTAPFNQKVGRENSPNLVQLLQDNYVQPQHGGAQPTGNNSKMTGVNDMYLTASQVTQKNIVQGRR